MSSIEVPLLILISGVFEYMSSDETSKYRNEEVH